MSDGGSNSFMASVLGGVVVVLVIIGIVLLNDGNFGGGSISAVKIEVPKVTK